MKFIDCGRGLCRDHYLRRFPGLPAETDFHLPDEVVLQTVFAAVAVVVAAFVAVVASLHSDAVQILAAVPFAAFFAVVVASLHSGAVRIHVADPFAASSELVVVLPRSG